jgi:hypothetical protein
MNPTAEQFLGPSIVAIFALAISVMWVPGTITILKVAFYYLMSHG